MAERVPVNKASDDTATGFEILNTCEMRDEALRAHIKRPWYRHFCKASPFTPPYFDDTALTPASIVA